MKASAEKIDAAIRRYHVQMSSQNAAAFGKAAARYPEGSDTAKNLRLVASGNATRAEAWREGRTPPKASEEESRALSHLLKSSLKDKKLMFRFGMIAAHRIVSGIAFSVMNPEAAEALKRPAAARASTPPSVRAPAAE